MPQVFTGEEAAKIFMNTISPRAPATGPQQTQPTVGPQPTPTGITPPVTATGKDATETTRDTAAAGQPTYETGVRAQNAAPDSAYKDNYNPYRSTNGSGVTASGVSYDIPAGYDWGSFIADNPDIDRAFAAQGWTADPNEYAQWWSGAGAANNEQRFIDEFGVQNPINTDDPNDNGILDPGEDNRTGDEKIVDDVIGGDLTDDGGGPGSKLPDDDPGNLGNPGEPGPGGIYGPTSAAETPRNVAGEVPRSPSLRSVRRATRKRTGAKGQTDVIKTSGQGLTAEANTLVKTLLGS